MACSGGWPHMLLPAPRTCRACLPVRSNAQPGGGRTWPRALPLVMGAFMPPPLGLAASQGKGSTAMNRRPAACALALAIATCFAVPVPAARAADAPAAATANPFDAPSSLPFQAPDFARIKDADFAPAFAEAMRRQQAEVRAIADNPD